MTSGPDEIPSLVIRDCAAVFADPLCFLFNLILNTSCYPMRWKTSAVRPIHKKDDRSEITNYRPIALISNFAKVFELNMSCIIPHSIMSLTSYLRITMASQSVGPPRRTWCRSVNIYLMH
jgi:hypothetical protein